MKQAVGSKKPAKGCLGFSLLISIPIILVVVLVLGELILVAMGGILIIADPLRDSDAIAVLSGGGDMSRLQEGATIFLEKKAAWLVLTEITPKDGEKVTDTTTLFKEVALKQGVPNSAILVTSKAAFSTQDEARQILNLAQNRNFKSIIVVTDPFHTFRTRLIFKSVFRGSGMDIYVRPVRGHWYKSTTWWLSPEGRQATFSEYIKIAAYFIGLQRGFME